MNNSISLKHNSDEESSSSWSEITAPSSPFSDTDDTSSWILISKIALEVNDGNNDDEQEEEDTESYYSQNLQEEKEEEEQESSSEELEIMDQKVPSSSSSSSSSRPSSETFISVLIRERVLHRLPAKQLLKLRTVSRQWNDFITSPFFIHSHSQSSISISGVFYIRPSDPINHPSFNPFNKDLHGLQSPELKFLPEPVAVLSSSRGLLCCQGFSGETTKYFIVNPITGSWVLLPPPANNHGIKPAAIIVFDEPFMFNFTLDYKLVVAYDLGGCYGFEIFRSREWEWSVSSELCVTEEIVPESGVAAGGCAHWRTSMQTVVSYNPETDKNWDVVWPESYREDVSWELIEINGKLTCVCVKDDEVCVYGSEGSGWKEVRKMRMMGNWGSREVKVVRVQEVKEVVLVENGRVWGWSLEDGKWREGDWFVGEGCEKFVSFVGSLLHAYGSWG